ncbi:hypothetical protein Tco_0281640 [Tanacetum coccineum]
MLESNAYNTYYAFADGEQNSNTKSFERKLIQTHLPRRSLFKLLKVALTEAEQIKLATKKKKGLNFTSLTQWPHGDGVDISQRFLHEQQKKVSGTMRISSDDEVVKKSRTRMMTVKKMNQIMTEMILLTPTCQLIKQKTRKKKKQMKKKCILIRKCQHHETMNSLKKKNIKRIMIRIRIVNKEKEEDDLYRDLNINLERSDAEMTDAQANQDMEDTHVTLTTVPLVVQQQSSSISSDLVSKFINPSLDTGIDSILNQDTQSDTLVNVPVSVAAETPSSGYYVALESEMSEFRQTSQFAKVVSLILGIVDTYLASKMKEAVDVAVQLQTHKLREEAQAENQEFLNQIDSTMKGIIKEQVQAQVSKIMPKIEKYVTKSLGAKVLVRSTNQPQTSYAVAPLLLEFKLKKILIDKMETNKLIDRSDTQKNLYNALVESYNTNKDINTSYGKYAHAEEHDQMAVDLEDQPHQEFNTRYEDESLARETLNEDVWHRNPLRPPTPNREWHKTKTIDNRPPQPWITQMAQAAGTQSLFNEFLATPIDFSAFIMHRLKIDNLTQEVLTGPTYDLIKGTCKSVVELEYHLEEVFKATNDLRLAQS